MICQNCQENEARIQLHVNINGHQQNIHLCNNCFQEQKAKMGIPFGGNGSMNGFSGFGSLEDFLNGNKESAQDKQKQSSKGNTFLEQFGRNLTSMAKAGVIDPVIGREEEIQRVVEILNRRNKNNPVLIGDPGVGKTAISEGLALKIAEGNVPSKLKNKEVYLLDVASLVANTGVRGQFEERMKQLINELQTKKNIILFVDEIHLLVGAGSAEGSMDASNILKPALARGELQLIGATTLDEYRQIEKDGALERRFQPVLVDEPSIEEAVAILDGLKEKYETYHGVHFSDESIRACVTLSHRYIQDRQLPDKAIDLMDEAGSKLNLTLSVVNKEETEQRLEQIKDEKQQALESENYETAAKLRDEEEKLKHSLENEQSVDTPSVSVALIQDILEQKTGIPVGKLQEDEQKKLKTLQANLAENVIGQDKAVEKVAKAIRRSRAGLKSKHRPIGSFLFVGPTGVGKTELSKTLAQELFGTKDSLVRLDMSEYMEKHSVSKLIGSPPGYVGHEEAGQLTEKVRRNPYSIILLDEIEKAHPDVLHLFLQILDDGRLTDSQGRTISFKETVIIMTSNAGVGHKSISVGFGNENHDESGITASLSQYFKPEFLNRLDNIIEFKALEKDHLLQIVDLLLAEVSETLAEQGITINVSDEAKMYLAEKGYDPAYGARPLRRAIQTYLEDQIADYILDEPEEHHLFATISTEELVVNKAE